MLGSGKKSLGWQWHHDLWEENLQKLETWLGQGSSHRWESALSGHVLLPSTHTHNHCTSLSSRLLLYFNFVTHKCFSFTNNILGLGSLDMCTRLICFTCTNMSCKYRNNMLYISNLFIWFMTFIFIFKMWLSDFFNSLSNSIIFSGVSR